MDEQFVVAVEVAFRCGLEDPDTAARTYDHEAHAVTLAPSAVARTTGYPSR
jgi:hypothetical protein